MTRILGVAGAIWLMPLLCAQPPKISARDLYYEAEGSAAVPATHHLGLRYNLVKVDPATKKTETVDPEANFKQGDCFAIEFTPNQNGQLYVLNRGSSGEWQALMPSRDMPNEAATVQANTTVRIPREYCFQLDGTRGVETLTVAIAASDAHLDQKDMIVQVRQWQTQQMTGRDLVLGKTADNTVYAVEAPGKKDGHVALEIRIRHE